MRPKSANEPQRCSWRTAGVPLLSGLHARQLDARIEVHLSKHATHGGQFPGIDFPNIQLIGVAAGAQRCDNLFPREPGEADHLFQMIAASHQSRGFRRRRMLRIGSFVPFTDISGRFTDKPDDWPLLDTALGKYDAKWFLR